MDFAQYAHKFKGKLKRGNVVQVCSYSNLRTPEIYYFLGFRFSTSVGPHILVSNELRKKDPNGKIIPLEQIASMTLYRPVRKV